MEVGIEWIGTYLAAGEADCDDAELILRREELGLDHAGSAHLLQLFRE